MKELVDQLNQLLHPPYLYYALGAVVVLLTALLIARRYRRSHQGIIPFKTQGGIIEIAPNTLRGVMQNAVNSVEGVERAACRHFLKGRNIGVRVAVHLRANHRLRDVDALIKKRIRATLLDQFGMETVEPIHIRVTRIIGDPVAVVPDSDKKDALFEEEAPALEENPLQNSNEDEDERPYSEDTRL